MVWLINITFIMSKHMQKIRNGIVKKSIGINQICLFKIPSICLLNDASKPEGLATEAMRNLKNQYIYIYIYSERERNIILLITIRTHTHSSKIT